MPLDPKLRAKPGTQMVADKAEFLLNWRILTEGPSPLASISAFHHSHLQTGSLHFLDWSNIFAAGGSVLACLSPVPAEHDTPAARRTYFREKYPGSDIDLFIYGLDEAGAKAKMEQIYNCIIDACPFETTVFRYVMYDRKTSCLVLLMVVLDVLDLGRLMLSRSCRNILTVMFRY